MWNRTSLSYYKPGCSTDRYLYPQIVIPADRPKEFACPISHVKQAKAFLSTCTDFLIIGFSGHDDHIVRLLEMIPNRSRITVVGKGTGNAQQSFDTMRSRAPILNDKDLSLSFHDEGFSEFLASEGFQVALYPTHE